MKQWLVVNKLYWIGALIGAIAGFLYWQQIGCTTGSCTITSKPTNATLYFAIMGSLFFGLFKRNIPENDVPEET